MAGKKINPQPRRFKDPDKALEAVIEIYDNSRKYLRDCFDVFCDGKHNTNKVSAYYPYVKVNTKQARRSDTRLSYGFVSKPGVYKSTVTRPDLFCAYYREQFRLLIKNHQKACRLFVL